MTAHVPKLARAGRSARLRLALLLVAATLAIAASGIDLPTPGDHVVLSAGPVASSRVPAGVLEGRVVDANGGAVTGAVVSDRHPGAARARTDDAGRFRLAIGAGEYDLQVSGIGFRRVSVPFSAAAGQGYAAVIVLRDTALVCVEAGAGAPAVHLRVRSATSAPLPPSVVATVSSGGWRETKAVSRGYDMGAVTADFAVDRPEKRFDVSVRAAGFREWTASGLRVGTHPCAPAPPAFADAVLVPE